MGVGFCELRADLKQVHWKEQQTWLCPCCAGSGHAPSGRGRAQALTQSPPRPPPRPLSGPLLGIGLVCSVSLSRVSVHEWNVACFLGIGPS